MEKQKLVKPMSYKKIIRVMKKAGAEDVSSCVDYVAEVVYHAQFGNEGKVLGVDK